MAPDGCVWSNVPGTLNMDKSSDVCVLKTTV